MRALLLTAAIFFSQPLAAQFIQPAPHDNFSPAARATLKPPAVAKVAVFVFEDLACPSCAANHPKELAAIEQTHVPLLRYDFPLPAHVWTYEGAVCARYIQDHISPQMAVDFRGDVFANQRLFSTRDDIDRYLRSWLGRHGQQAPKVIDPGGRLAQEVGADLQFGNQLHVEYTPTIIVVTHDRYQVVYGTAPQPGANDITRLIPVIQAAQASSNSRK